MLNNPPASTSDALSTTPAYKCFKLLAQGVDFKAAMADVRKHQAAWPLMDLRQRYGPAHKDTETIALRGPPTAYDILNNLESMNYTMWNSFQGVGSLLLELMEILSAREIGRVMLVKLKPGGEILPHTDEGSYAEYYARFHFPLQSLEGNDFYCSADSTIEHVHMLPGELWWFNHRRQHGFTNKSSQPRIHLIFDACAPGFTGALG